MKVTFPLAFEMVNQRRPPRSTHCGVLEFTAEEGKVYVPHWVRPSASGLWAWRTGTLSTAGATFVRR
jgi:hypothetical protein